MSLQTKIKVTTDERMEKGQMHTQQHTNATVLMMSYILLLAFYSIMIPLQRPLSTQTHSNLLNEISRSNDVAVDCATHAPHRQLNMSLVFRNDHQMSNEEFKK